ncbi:MAG: hypothetical protein CSB55_02715 [Candidatus Cloacimonadota bacterium]|nr:MAG: hypothetical protein CSB55_02715 [Candidatus Cloacimonadota bacterium]
MIKKFTLFSLGTLFVLTGCVQSNYQVAESLFAGKKYAGAIEYYDKFLENSENGATKTMAQINRNQCYLKLGIASYEIENFRLATRFFYLANTPEADTYLDDCYYKLSLEAGDDIRKVMAYYRTVIDEIPNSDLAPELLYKSIEAETFELKDKEKAWADYKILVDRFPDDEYVLKSQKIIDTFIPEFIDSAENLKKAAGYRPALDQLFVLAEYPSGYKNRIYEKIADIYIEYGEYYIKEREFIKAEKKFRSAEEYDPSKSAYIEKRLRDICMLFIEKGDEYLAERDIENAVLRYSKAFDIIPELNKAKEAIAKARELEINIKKAKKLSAEAQKYEYKKDYANALKFYRKAYEADKLKIYAQKAELNGNLVKAEKNPIPFAREILFKHKNGKIPNEIYKIETKLREKYGDEITTSGWKFLISIGQFQYEARYDIFSPETTDFFVWKINLADREIVPLNKASEEISK